MHAFALMLADSRFPGGGHVHSGGLEEAAARGLIRTEADLPRFLHVRLHTAGLLSATFAAASAHAARQGANVWAELDAELDARTPSAAQRAASRAQGRATTRAGRAIMAVDNSTATPENCRGSPVGWKTGAGGQAAAPAATGFDAKAQASGQSNGTVGGPVGGVVGRPGGRPSVDNRLAAAQDCRGSQVGWKTGAGGQAAAPATARFDAKAQVSDTVGSQLGGAESCGTSAFAALLAATPQPQHAIVLGVLVAEVEAAALAAAYLAVSGPASASVRLLGLDPLRVNAIVWALAPAIQQVAAAAAATADRNPAELPAPGAPGLDLLAEEHDRHHREEVRLFAS